jgi:hypothetical protein
MRRVDNLAGNSVNTSRSAEEGELPMEDRAPRPLWDYSATAGPAERPSESLQALGDLADNQLQLIKKLSATPVIQPLGDHNGSTAETLDPQAALQANKATFFFRLVPETPLVTFEAIINAVQDREIEKVNTFYLLKEAEVRFLLRPSENCR